MYLNDFDWFVTCELGGAYLRYVNDFVLFSDNKRLLREWRAAIVSRLEHERLTIYAAQAQALSAAAGIAWLGFVVFPAHRLLKRRNAVHFTRKF